jgi:hypothetical protein
MQRQRPPRAVALLNGGVAVVILVVVAAFGVAVSQSPPPSIAAYAPEVQQRAHQNSLAGQQGAGALGATTPTGMPSTPTPATPSNAANHPGATPTPNPLAGRPAQLRCYGSPPHQTDDPQSPPCLQSFDGDNGGATWRGVTRDTVYVAWPDMRDGFPGIENPQYTNDMLAYFNSHFQMYGRKLELLETTVAGGYNGFASPSAQQQVQDADKAANELNHGAGVFASIGYAPAGGTAYYYYDRLAQDGVLSVQSSPLLVTESHIASSPYLWSTVPGYDRVEANLANLYCNQLRGQQAQYGGPPTPPQTTWGTRKLAVYYETTTNNIAIDPHPFVSTLNACGVQATAHALSDDSASYTAAVNTMQQDQDTTVACMCSPPQLIKLMNAATNQAFFPEWLVSNEQFLAADSSPQQFPSSQQGHVIGIDFNNEMLDPQNEFWWRAVKEADPGAAYQQNGQQMYAYYRYQELLVLATGIQQAGPHLTPQSFQQGLYDTRYSNVGHGKTPYYQAQVGFGPGDHSFYQDAAAIWFSPSGQSYTTNQGSTGTYCYSNGGDRSADWTTPAPAYYDTRKPCRGG